MTNKLLQLRKNIKQAAQLKQISRSDHFCLFPFTQGYTRFYFFLHIYYCNVLFHQYQSELPSQTPTGSEQYSPNFNRHQAIQTHDSCVSQLTLDAHLSVETPYQLGFSCITISMVYREWSVKEKISREQQFYGQNALLRTITGNIKD